MTIENGVAIPDDFPERWVVLFYAQAEWERDQRSATPRANARLERPLGQNTPPDATPSASLSPLRRLVGTTSCDSATTTARVWRQPPGARSHSPSVRPIGYRSSHSSSPDSAVGRRSDGDGNDLWRIDVQRVLTYTPPQRRARNEYTGREVTDGKFPDRPARR